VENTAKKWTKRKAVAVVIILGAADSLLLCLSILRERKKERKREREIKERSHISSLRCSFPPKRQESTDERDKNRTTNVSIFLLGLDTLNVFFVLLIA
jgi:hypothetical protein